MPASCRYQLYAKEIILDGAGLLYEKFQALKAELLEMGMFAPEYKKAVPKYARTVGVVTAPTGAAIRDIINISRRRNPYVQIILYPALVQGEGAVSSIVKGIHMLEEKQVDVIIVGRGGGSIEDLWAFNEEAVARAIFECGIPVISAVGHETDTTIADYVADLRAPTPSAAAELAVYEYREVREQMELLAGKMRRSMGQMLHLKRLKLEKYQTRLGYLSPAGKLREYRQRAADYEERLPQLFAELFKTKKDKYRELELALQELMKDRIKENRQLLAILIERMKGLSPLRKLNQGFAYVQNAEGKTVKTTEDVKRKETLTVYVADGAIESVITDLRKEEYHGGE